MNGDRIYGRSYIIMQSMPVVPCYLQMKYAGGLPSFEIPKVF